MFDKSIITDRLIHINLHPVLLLCGCVSSVLTVYNSHVLQENQNRQLTNQWRDHTTTVFGDLYLDLKVCNRDNHIDNLSLSVRRSCDSILEEWVGGPGVVVGTAVRSTLPPYMAVT